MKRCRSLELVKYICENCQLKEPIYKYDGAIDE